MFRNKTIRRRVMEAIDKKIDEAEVEVENRSKDLQRSYEIEVLKLSEKLATDKEVLIEAQVNKILGKII